MFIFIKQIEDVFNGQRTNQEQDFQNFGCEVCNRVTTLENQRKAVLAGIK